MIDNIYKDFKFRKATNSELPIIKNLIASVLQEYQLEFDVNQADQDLIDLDKSYGTNNGFFGVITDSNNRIIGTLALYNLGNKIAEIKKMYLHKDYRGLGIGKQSMIYLIELAKKKRYDRLEIETASVLASAIKLYEKFGFKYDRSKKIISKRCDVAMYLDLF